MPVCDVCNKTIEWADGYYLTTTEVAESQPFWEAYWQRVVSRLGSDGMSAARLTAYVSEVAGSTTGWLVCEGCSRLFTFNRALAREYAKNQATPIGGGPAALPRALAAAQAAWNKLYGS